MAVSELRKPMYAACQHCGPAGCNVYGSHPQTCSQWQCLWAAGVMDEADRPDRCGVMFDQSIIDDVPVISIHEVIPHALEARQRVSTLVDKIKAFGLRTDEIHEWPFGTRGNTTFATDPLTYPHAPSGRVKRIPRGNNWYRMIPAHALSA
jgi:hypothetical protein